MTTPQEQFFFREHPGLKPETRQTERMATIALAVLALLLAAVILRSNGSLMATGAFLSFVIVLGATLYRVEYGFYALLGAALLFAQFEVPGFTTRTYRVGFFRNIKEIDYLPYFSKGDANPFELQFFFVIAIWLFRVIIQKDLKLRPVSLWGAAAVWFLWIIVALVNGMQRGGEFLPALWETRALAYLSLVSAFVPQVIQTRKQISTVIWISIFAISFKAFEGIGRYMDAGWTTGDYEAMQAHEDPVFIASLIVFMLALVVFKTGKGQLRAMLILLVPLLWGFWVGKRRAAYAAFFASFMAFAALIPNRSFIRGLKIIGPLIFVAIIYTAVFWNSSSPLASPINSVRSGMMKEEGEDVVKDRDYYSNLYRKIEDYDLAITIQHAPLLGIGFGTRYEQPVPLVRLDFALRDYMAHNNVLWLFAKTGAVGFFLFWFYLNALAFKGGGMIGKLHDPYLKAICVLSVISLISLMVAAFFDLHLVRYRTMIFTGTLIGLLGSVETVEAAEQAKTSALTKAA